MNGLVDQLIAERRAQGDAADTTDLLGRMLTGVDKQSGEGLPDDEHPRAVHHLPHRRARDDLGPAVLRDLLPAQEPGRPGPGAGRGRRGAGQRRRAPTFEQVHRLTYVRQVLDESLRLWPTAPGVQPLSLRGHRDRRPLRHPRGHPDHRARRRRCTGTRSSGGPTPRSSTPSTWRRAAGRACPPNVYKPFGTGQRACIGRQFALQEATLVLGMLLQRFELVDHRDYQLRIKTTLTVKPDDFHIQVRPRPDVRHRRAPAAPQPAQARPAPRRASRRRTARRRGPPRHAAAGAVRLQPRHRRVHRHPARPGGHRARLRRDPRRARRPRRRPARRTGPRSIVCSSYNGTPPDNAAAFCRWISRRRAGRRRRRRVHRVRLRQHRVGRDLPGGAHADRRAARGARRPPGAPAR